jgi:Trk K+ transport system NAD-binding subunit
VAEFLVAGHLGEILAERRTQKMIDSLSDHYIICGFGRVGRQVARDLDGAGATYVVIDPNPVSREIASPYKASGTETARLALHPQGSGTVDVAAEYRMEEIEVVAGCTCVGQTSARCAAARSSSACAMATGRSCRSRAPRRRSARSTS